MNGFIELMFYNPTILSELEDKPVNQSYNLINTPELVKMSENSIKDYLQLIGGKDFNVTEKDFFNFKQQKISNIKRDNLQELIR